MTHAEIAEWLEKQIESLADEVCAGLGCYATAPSGKKYDTWVLGVRSGDPAESLRCAKILLNSIREHYGLDLGLRVKPWEYTSEQTFLSPMTEAELQGNRRLYWRCKPELGLVEVEEDRSIKYRFYLRLTFS